jgi:hypothetical protein
MINRLVVFFCWALDDVFICLILRKALPFGFRIFPPHPPNIVLEQVNPKGRGGYRGGSPYNFVGEGPLYLDTLEITVIHNHVL